MKPHGENARYGAGCRCPLCCEARAIYMREYRLKRKHAGTPVHATRAPKSGRGELDRWVHDGRLQVSCWCEDAILLVPVNWVRRGLTYSCGRDNCTSTATEAA